MNPTASHVLAPESKASNLKIEAGTVTTVSASDLVQTKLKNVRYVYVSGQDDPVAGASRFTAVPSTLGRFTLKGWKSTATADTALVAATTFSKVVTYIAIGE